MDVAGAGSLRPLAQVAPNVMAQIHTSRTPWKFLLQAHPLGLHVELQARDGDTCDHLGAIHPPAPAGPLPGTGEAARAHHEVGEASPRASTTSSTRLDHHVHEARLPRRRGPRSCRRRSPRASDEPRGSCPGGGRIHRTGSGPSSTISLDPFHERRGSMPPGSRIHPARPRAWSTEGPDPFREVQNLVEEIRGAIARGAGLDRPDPRGHCTGPAEAVHEVRGSISRDPRVYPTSSSASSTRPPEPLHQARSLVEEIPGVISSGPEPSSRRSLEPSRDSGNSSTRFAHPAHQAPQPRLQGPRASSTRPPGFVDQTRAAGRNRACTRARAW
jgi:hypothetical protein